jgi:thymidylate kinase
MKIAIGICARNEECSIVPMLDSLIPLILKDSEGIEFHVFICANGCSDQTVPLIKAWRAKNYAVPSSLFVEDEANLIESQRTIVTEAKKSGFENVIFLDADVIVNKNCLIELARNSIDEKVKAAYAVSTPIQRKNQSLIEKALNLYDTSSGIFSERKHLHGRAFLIKTDVWNIPKTSPKLIADDIYLSFYILKNFGCDSIRKVSTANVSFNQVSSYNDFYKAFRRRILEINKCLVLFPDFKHLPPDQVNRSFLWKNLIKEPVKNIFLWMFLLSVRKIAKLQFKTESLFEFEENNQWVATKTSKKIDPGKKPILVLIEGLDCSGKKTTARLLQSKLIKDGISCVINIGPLKSKIYRSVSRLVSLHRFPNFIRSTVYAFDGCGDKKWYKNFTSDVVIQISSPMRNWAYALVNKKYIRIFIMFLIKNNIPKYDLIWYLTAPYNTRLERHASQAKHKENPDEIKDRFPGEIVFNKMESKLKTLLNTRNKIDKEFDTAVSPYDEITSHMADKIRNHVAVGNSLYNNTQ